MLEDLLVIHTQSELDLCNFLEQNSGSSVSWLHWQTCVRQVSIGFSDSSTVSSLSSLEVYEGPEAYGFLVEVVSGLHSPMVGETEVYGQFRLLLEKAERDFSDVVGSMFHQIFQRIFTDVKEVRSLFLLGGGSQSYGGICRRYFEEFSSIGVLGGGHLSQEILPWLLKDDKEIFVFCRRLEQLNEILEGTLGRRNESLKGELISHLKDKIFLQAIVVAAPLDARVLVEQIKEMPHLKYIVDLRSESSKDSLRGLVDSDYVSLIDLEGVFKQMEHTRKQMSCNVKQARNYINGLVQKRFRHQEVRPFGWHEVCA